MGLVSHQIAKQLQPQQQEQQGRHYHQHHNRDTAHQHSVSTTAATPTLRSAQSRHHDLSVSTEETVSRVPSWQPVLIQPQKEASDQGSDTCFKKQTPPTTSPGSDDTHPMSPVESIHFRAPSSRDFLQRSQNVLPCSSLPLRPVPLEQNSKGTQALSFIPNRTLDVTQPSLTPKRSFSGQSETNNFCDVSAGCGSPLSTPHLTAPPRYANSPCHLDAAVLRTASQHKQVFVLPQQLKEDNVKNNRMGERLLRGDVSTVHNTKRATVLPHQQSVHSMDMTFDSRAPLCQCPCRNCTTCPFRGSASGRHCQRASSCNSQDLGQIHVGSEGTLCRRQSRSCFRRFCDRIQQFCSLEAEDDPLKYRYDCRVIPEVPIKKAAQRILAITELPFMILWVYFTYWAVIVSMTAATSPATVWLSATIAGLLVGIGLNANAYKSLMVPHRRGSIRHHRHATALLELKKYGESIGTVEMVVDWGMVIRFFIIPFAVSCLSGLTNSNRHDFLLVFPIDPYYLTIAIMCPTTVVAVLALIRITLLWRLKVRWSLQVLFLNGALVD